MCIYLYWNIDTFPFPISHGYLFPKVILDLCSGVEVHIFIKSFY